MPSSSVRSMHTWAVVALLAMSWIWGGSFAAMKFALQAHLGVGVMLSLRFTLGALALLGFMVALRKPMTRQGLKDGVLLGLVLTTVFWLQADGLRYTTTAKSGFITGLYVIFTPLVSPLFGLRPKASHAAGAAVAALGLFMLVHEPGKPFGGWNFGDTETLVCALACGFHIVLTGLFGRRTDGWVLAFGQVATVACLSWVLTLLMPAAPTTDGTTLGGASHLADSLRQPGVWISLAYQGLLATALAFYLMSAFQKHLGATEAAVIYSLEPVFTALVAMSGFVPGVKEHLGPTQLLGGGIILGAMLLAELGPRLFREREPAEG